MAPPTKCPVPRISSFYSGFSLPLARHQAPVGFVCKAWREPGPLRGVIYFGGPDGLTRWESNDGLPGSAKLGFCSRCQVGAGVGRAVSSGRQQGHPGDRGHPSLVRGAHDGQSSLGCVMGLSNAAGLTCTQGTGLRSE